MSLPAGAKDAALREFATTTEARREGSGHTYVIWSRRSKDVSSIATVSLLRGPFMLRGKPAVTDRAQEKTGPASVEMTEKSVGARFRKRTRHRPERSPALASWA